MTVGAVDGLVAAAPDAVWAVIRRFRRRGQLGPRHRVISARGR
jgi:hypothetical protein